MSEPQLISELCHKNVIKFFNGHLFAMALTNDNQLYAWRRIREDFHSFTKPTKMFEFECEIENICCSWGNALVLNVEGIVYGWGDNSEGQIKDQKEKFITKPLKLHKLPQIKFIACNDYRSLAVSEDNQIFVWGKDIYDNIIIKCEHDILNICVNEKELYIVTRNIKLLYCDLETDNRIFKNIELVDSIEYVNKNNVIKLFSTKSDLKTVVLLVIKDFAYCLTGKELVRTQYKNIYDYCAEELQITYKTIDLKLQNEIQTKELRIKGKN